MPLPIGKTVPFLVAFIDAKGNPTTLSPVAITVDNPALATLFVGIDGLSGTLTAVGPLGTVTVTASGTRPDGVVVTATGTIDIIAGEAVGGTITFGDPV